MNIAKNYLIPKFEEEYAFNEGNELQEKIELTDASIMQIVNHYCGYVAGVRNLRKCIDRVFRKIVAKLEMQSIEKKELTGGAESDGESAAGVGLHLVDEVNSGLKEYQVNSKNLERFLDVAATDDHYYNGINK